MSVHAVLYSTPNCMKCRTTYSKLSSVMPVKIEKLFDEEQKNNEWSNRKIEKFKAQGYRSFPVMRIYDDETGERLDEWCDFNVKKIQHWIQTVSA